MNRKNSAALLVHPGEVGDGSSVCVCEPAIKGHAHSHHDEVASVHSGRGHCTLCDCEQFQGDVDGLCTCNHFYAAHDDA